MLETERLTLRAWTETDAESLYVYAKDPDIGPIAGWPAHRSKEESLNTIRHVLNGKECCAIWCGYYDGNLKSKRVQEKVGFVYHHTCDEVPVPLMHEVRVEHVNILTNRVGKLWLPVDRVGS